MEQSPCPETDACVMLGFRKTEEGQTVWLGGCATPGDREAGEECDSPIEQCAKGLGCVHI